MPVPCNYPVHYIPHMADAPDCLHAIASMSSFSASLASIRLSFGSCRSEESKLEEYVKAIAASGTSVVISGSSIGEMAMHFLEKYGIMVVKVPSKFELMRICKSTGATAKASFTAPTPEELGFVKSLQVSRAGATWYLYGSWSGKRLLIAVALG